MYLIYLILTDAFWFRVLKWADWWRFGSPRCQRVNLFLLWLSFLLFLLLNTEQQMNTNMFLVSRIPYLFQVASVANMSSMQAWPAPSPYRAGANSCRSRDSSACLLYACKRTCFNFHLWLWQWEKVEQFSYYSTNTKVWLWHLSNVHSSTNT